MRFLYVLGRRRLILNSASRTFSTTSRKLKNRVPDVRPSISVYVHFPYCSQICSFCAFNKYKLPADLNHQALYESYVKELSYYLRHYAQNGFGKTIRSIYFGGGTPSLSPWLVQYVIDGVHSQGFQLDDQCEITLEANPSSLPDLKMLSSLGVTRVSLGVQSLVNDPQLRKFNREHGVSQSRDALDRLVAGQDAGLLTDGFSFDLMFGNPIDPIGEQQQDNSSIRFSEELRAALPYARVGGHLSLYELTLEHGTPLHKTVEKGQIAMPDQDSNAEEYEQAIRTMTTNGFDHYEISSFALPGHYSRHNFSFWMHEDLIGIGPGAHGRITSLAGYKERTRNIPDPKRWARQIHELGHGQARLDPLRESFAQECIALALRTEVGVSQSHFEAVTGLRLSDHLDMHKIRELQKQGLVDWLEDGQSLPSLPKEFQDCFIDGSLRATERGRSVLDLITPMIFKDAVW